MKCTICSFAIAVDQPAEAAALVMQAHVLMHVVERLDRIAAELVGKS